MAVHSPTGAGGARHRRALRWDRYNYYLFVFSAAAVGAVVLAILLFIGVRGLATFRAVSPFAFFFSALWQPPERLGVAAFIVGSLGVTTQALLRGAPRGVAGAIFLAKVAPAWARGLLRPAIDLLAGIPSVVYGWIGLTIFVPLIRKIPGGGSGFSLLAAGVILGIMILPTVIGIATDALMAVPVNLEEGSLALGATRWQTVWGVLLPAARPGVLTAVVLGMARAIGETMAVQMVIGNTPRLATSLLSPTTSLTSGIVMDMGNTQFGTPWNDALFMMAFLLLIISLGLILLVRWIGRRGVA